jgi:hypothetical protein
VIGLFGRFGVRDRFAFGAEKVISLGLGAFFDDIGMTAGFAFLVYGFVP